MLPQLSEYVQNLFPKATIYRENNDDTVVFLIKIDTQGSDFKVTLPDYFLTNAFSMKGTVLSFNMAILTELIPFAIAQIRN